jgi:putative membrane protein
MRLSRSQLAFSLVLLPVLAHAHEGEGVGLATTWSWEPSIVIPLALAGSLYAVGWLRMRRAGAERSLPGTQAACFLGGWFTLALALLSPVHALGEVSLAAHMVQHELLMVVAAPLLVLGRPLLPFLWALPVAARERLGHFFQRPSPAKVWAALTAPVFVLTFQALAILVWHAPRFYDAAVLSESIHALEHSTFLVAALLFWWTLIHGRYGRLGYGAAMLFVFLTAMYSGALGALLTVAPHSIYSSYQHGVLGMTATEDQQLAGLIMWVPAGVVLVLAGLGLIDGWRRESERRVRYSTADTLAAAVRTGRDA